MTYYILKIVITSIIIALISEISKRNSFMGAVLASIPLISVLAMIWLYIDTKDTTKIITLSNYIFWLVLPSLTLFITLPLLLKQNINFYLSLTVAILATAFAYWIMTQILKHFGIVL